MAGIPQTGWYYSQGQAANGPLDFSDLMQKVQSGEIDKDNMVWHQSYEQWTEASKAPEFQSVWKAEWHYTDKNQGAATGPVDVVTLFSLARKGDVIQTTLVWRDGIQWTPITDVPELKPVAGAIGGGGSGSLRGAPAAPAAAAAAAAPRGNAPGGAPRLAGQAAAQPAPQASRPSGGDSDLAKELDEVKRDRDKLAAENKALKKDLAEMSEKLRNAEDAITKAVSQASISVTKAFQSLQLGK